MEEMKALLEETKPIKISVDKQNILHKIGWLPKEKTIELKPLPYGCFIQIAKCFSGISVFEGETIKDICELIRDNNEAVTKAVAYAINRTEKEPSKELIQFIHTNIQMEDLTGIILFILTQMQLGNFTIAISLLTKKVIADSSQEEK